MPRNANQSKSTNYSLDFLGGQQIDSSSNLGISGASPRTFSAWIKTTDGGGGWDVIVATGNTGNTGNNFELDFRSGKITFNDWGTDTFSGATVNDGNWHNICLTYNGTILKLYIDGIEDTAGDFPATKSVSSTDTPVRIGGMNHSSKYFSGQIDEVAIFDYALSQSQVTTLYGTGSAIGNPMALPIPPKAYYPLGESAGGFVGGTGTWLTENNAIGDYVFDFKGAGTSLLGPHINLGNDSSLSPSSEITVSIWIKTDSNSPLTASGYLDKYSGGGYLLDFGGSSGTNKAGIKFGSSGTRITSTTVVADQKWHNILFTCDNTTLRFYVDGNEEVTSSATIADLTSTENLKIGGDGSSVYYFDGKISNTQIFNTALTGPEVETLYNYGSPIRTLANIPQSSSLKAWYKLDATEIYNSTSTEWSIDNNQNPSAYPSSLDFSGTDQYISCSSSSVFQNTSNFSVSFWVNMDDYSGGGCLLMSQGGGSNIFHIYAYGGNTIQVRLRENNLGNGLISNVDLNNKWSNICLVYDGTKTGNSNRLKFYINKVEQTISFNQDIQSSINIGGDFLIGKESGQNPIYTIDGKLSNVSLFSNSLTDGTGGTLNQIKTLYNNGTPLADMSSFSSLVSWWKLNNTTTGVEDSKGSNNGTNNGATEYPGFVNTLAGYSTGMSQSNLVQSDLQTVAPYSKYALNFNGTGDYIDLNSDITLTGNKSVSFWVNFTSTISGVVFGGASNNYYPYIDATNINIRAGGTLSDISSFAHGGLTSGVWYNICITGDGTNATAYLNGSSLGTQTDRGFTFKLINGEHTGLYGVDGKLSNCAIWNTVLTSSQVREIYNEGRPSNLHNFSGTAPIAWWQLGSNSSWTSPAWTVLDEIGSNNGTSSSMLENTIVDGVGTSGNGVSTGMGLANNISGSSPSGEANSLSVNMTLANIAGGVN